MSENKDATFYVTDWLASLARCVVVQLLDFSLSHTNSLVSGNVVSLVQEEKAASSSLKPAPLPREKTKEREKKKKKR